jgi:diguanylate cyclase (GGDEF)-like protein/PAS domain S-box-containing protein
MEQGRARLDAFLSRGTDGLEPRDASTVRRFSTYSLIAMVGAAYSMPFHLAVAGFTSIGCALVGIDLVCGAAFGINRRRYLARLTDHPYDHRQLAIAANVLMAIASAFLTTTIVMSGGLASPILLYLSIAPVTMAYLLGEKAGVIWGAIALVLMTAIGTIPEAFGYAAVVTFPPMQAMLSLLAILTALALASKRVTERQANANEALSVELASHNARLERQSVSLAEARDRAEAASQSHEARFEAGFETSRIGLVLLGPDGVFLRANPALCAMLGYETDEIVGRRFANFAHPEDRRSDAAALRALSNGELATWERDERYIHKDGSVVWVRLHAAALRSPDGVVDGFFTQVEDITEKRHHEEDLAYRATHDALTGLANRAMFLERLRVGIDRLDRSGERRGAAITAADDAATQLVVLFVDIDQFKILNDSLGHAMGDQLLVGVADRLRDHLVDVDTVARFGGDEFAVLAEVPAGSNEQARAVADQVQRALVAPFLLDGQAICATASIGIVTSTDPNADPADLLRHADTAMYRAKAEGRATSRLFDDTMRASMARRYELARQLGTALDAGQLRVHYQPEVDLLTNRVIGVEALVRWEHPDKGLLTAGTFIDIAEETGIIVPIGAWVLEEALRQAARWPSLEDGSPLLTRINLSANQLTQDDFAKTIGALLDEVGIACETVCFELTESALIDTGAAAMANIDAIRTLGVKLAIDDFGTGYSSMTYLKQIPADVLKIDLSFVQGLPTDARDRHIVASIVQLAKALGFDVVAEGVESEEQADILRSLGCRRAQGYLWGRSAPADAILAMLAAQAATARDH